MSSYDSGAIEKKWQSRWDEAQAFAADEARPCPNGKCYVLDMFPYPSAQGLHVGHPIGYIATDILARKRRMDGWNVLHPMGWDAFGLPAENYAIKVGGQPREITQRSVENYTRQLKLIGFSYDWAREINTSLPEYYKWTQWMFLRLHERGLAYKRKAPVNWCPSCQTVLANEQVIDGHCERCKNPVVQKELSQWFFRITEYADRLLADLDGLDWPEKIKAMQRNWIGRSEGAEIAFSGRLEDGSEFGLTVFTTRADTLFGVTAVVIAPEHPLVRRITADAERGAVGAYVEAAKGKSELERAGTGLAEGKEKTGVFTGAYVAHPLTGELVPVYVADYVLMGYGTGAVMMVPAHDERDFAFARKYGIKNVAVIEPTYTQSAEPGKVREGEPYDHRESIIAIVKHWADEKYLALKWKQVAWGTFITGGIEQGQTPEEAAKAELLQETGYRNARFVKDFGVVHGKFYHVPKKTNRNAHAHVVVLELEDDARETVADEEAAMHEALWLTKEELQKFLTPDTHRYGLKLLYGEAGIWTDAGTLAHSGPFDRMESEEAKQKITAALEAEGKGKKKINYHLRDWLVSRQRYWGAPIPIILCDVCGEVPVPDADLPVRLPEDVDFRPTGESPLVRSESFHKVECPKCGAPARRESDTMDTFVDSSWYFLRFLDPKNAEAFASRSKIDFWCPVDVYVGGAEHAILHLLFARFFTKVLFDAGYVGFEEPFRHLRNQGLILGENGEKMSKSRGNVVNPDDVIAEHGADAFRLYEMFMGDFEQPKPWSTKSLIGQRRFLEKVWKLEPGGETPAELRALLHKTIKKVSEDVETFKFNTAISAMMILVNDAEKQPMAKGDYEAFLKLLAPFAPHMAEELWEKLGNAGFIAHAAWPSYDPALTVDAEIEIALQVSGKMKDRIRIPADADDAEVERLALENENVKAALAGKTVKQVIVVKKRLVNVVTG